MEFPVNLIGESDPYLLGLDTVGWLFLGISLILLIGAAWRSRHLQRRFNPGQLVLLISLASAGVVVVLFTGVEVDLPSPLLLPAGLESRASLLILILNIHAFAVGSRFLRALWRVVGWRSQRDCPGVVFDSQHV